jgi:uncharacterized repeat protein (TIGR01451 family)
MRIGASQTRLGRARLVAVVSILFASGVVASPAEADVTSLESSAFGVSITPLAATEYSLAEQPLVTFSNPPGPAATKDASQAVVQAPPTGIPPGRFFQAQSMRVRTGPVGTLGTHGAGTTSTADVVNAAYLLDELTGVKVHSECTATGDGSSGETKMASVSFTDKADGSFKTFTNYEPPPNTVFTLFNGLGTVTFNEQASLDSGQTTGIVVTAIHIQRGPIDIFVGQSRCTATGPDVVVEDPPTGCDLSVVKAMKPDQPASGEPITVTVTVTNVGTDACPAAGKQGNTRVVDQKPPGLILGIPTADKVGWACGDIAGDQTCTSSTPLQPGDTVTFVMQAIVTAGAGDTVRNCAVVENPSDGNLVNNTSCVQRELPEQAEGCDLGISKEMSPNPLITGQPATVTFTVTNVGTLPCDEPLVEDAMPAGLTFTGPPTSSPAGWACTVVLGGANPRAGCAELGPMVVGSSATFTLNGVVTGAAGSSVTNCARVEPLHDVALVNNKSCVTRQIVSPPPPPICDLEVVKTMQPDPLLAGSPATITLKVINHGQGPCQGAVLHDDKVAGLTLTPPAARQFGWFCGIASKGAGECSNFATLPGGYSGALILPARVDFDAPPSIENCATVTSASDTKTANNRSCAENTVTRTPFCDLAATKQMSPVPLVSGQAATMTITVAHIGNVPCTTAKATSVRDTAPPGLTFTGPPTGPAGWTCTGTAAAVKCTGPGTIAVGSTIVFTVPARVTGTPGEVVKNCASVIHAADVRAGNNGACATSGIVPPAGNCDLTTTKTASPQTVVSGGQVVYTVKVKNIGGGPCAATSLARTAMDDVARPGLTFVSRQPATGWTCPVAAGAIRCSTPNTMAPLQEATFFVRAVVTGTAGAVVGNCAKATNANDSIPANNEGCVNVRIAGSLRCDLDVTKVMTPAPLKRTVPAVITITVRNIGNGSCVGTVADPIRVEDASVGLQFDAAPKTGTSGWFCGLTDSSTAGCYSPVGLAPGATRVFTLQATVTAVPPGPLTNCATVSNPNDFNPDNDRSCVSRAVT